MRDENWDMYEKGDRVKIENCSTFDGIYGTVTVDQSYPDGNVIVKLDNSIEITITPDDLVYKG